jgi:transcriptional regulator with GAF, ATPase, and Fis domain
MLADLKQIAKRQPVAVSRTLAAAERDHILEVLDQSDWLIGGQQGAAVRLGLPRTTLIHRMRKLGIETRRSQRHRLLPFERAFEGAGESVVLAAAV